MKFFSVGSSIYPFFYEFQMLLISKSKISQRQPFHWCRKSPTKTIFFFFLFKCILMYWRHRNQFSHLLVHHCLIQITTFYLCMLFSFHNYSIVLLWIRINFCITYSSFFLSLTYFYSHSPCEDNKWQHLLPFFNGYFWAKNNISIDLSLWDFISFSFFILLCWIALIQIKSKGTNRISFFSKYFSFVISLFIFERYPKLKYGPVTTATISRSFSWSWSGIVSTSNWSWSMLNILTIWIDESSLTFFRNWIDFFSFKKQRPRTPWSLTEGGKILI